MNQQLTPEQIQQNIMFWNEIGLEESAMPGETIDLPYDNTPHRIQSKGESKRDSKAYRRKKNDKIRKALNKETNLKRVAQLKWAWDYGYYWIDLNLNFVY